MQIKMRLNELGENYHKKCTQILIKKIHKLMKNLLKLIMVFIYYI